MNAGVQSKEKKKIPEEIIRGSVPSGVDADGWHRKLAFDSSADFCGAIASFTRKCCSKKLYASSLEAFPAC